MMKKLKATKTATPKKEFGVTFADETALALSEHMGRRVKVNKGKKGGQLVIEYFDDDDLKSLAKALAED